MTVGELIEALSKLSSDIPIRVAYYGGDYELEETTRLLKVYEKDNVVILYIDDEEASHPKLEPYWMSLFSEYFAGS